MLSWNKETANPSGGPITWKTSRKSGKHFLFGFFSWYPKEAISGP